MLTRPCENGRSPTTNSESRVLQTSSGPPLTQGIGRVYRKEYRSSSSSVVFERGTELGFYLSAAPSLLATVITTQLLATLVAGTVLQHLAGTHPEKSCVKNGWGRLSYSLYLWQQLVLFAGAS